MAAKTWNQTTDTAWSVDSNWSPAGAPTASDDATIGGSYFVTGSGTSNRLTILGSGYLLGTISTVALSVGTGSTTGSVEVNSGGRLTAASATFQNGSVRVAGTGTGLAVSGVVTLIGDTLSVVSGSTMQVGGLSLSSGTNAVTVDSNSVLEVGTTGGAATGKLTVDAGYVFSGEGTVRASNGIVNQGTILAQGGTLLISSPLSGSGQLQIGAGGTLSVLDNPWAQAVTFVGTGGTLAIRVYFSTSPITGFVAGDTIAYSGYRASAATYRAGTGGLGTLTLTNGSSAVGTLTLAGDYTGSTFLLTPGAGSGQNFVVIPTPATTSGTAPAGTTAADAFTWTAAATGGNWGDARNWTDTTTGANPAPVPAGSNNAVTLQGPTGAQFQVVNGPGNASSLTALGNTVLNGTFNTGGLTIGAGSGASANPAWLDLVGGTVLNAASANLAAGTLQVSGAQAKLAVAGALTFGTSQDTVRRVNVSDGASVQAGSIAVTAGLDNALASSILTVDSTARIEVGTVGSAAAGTIQVDAGGLLSGSGSISAPNGIIDNGTILAAQGGTLVIPDKVTGTGQLQIGAGASLLLRNSSTTDTVPIAFVGPGGTLQITSFQTYGAGPRPINNLNLQSSITGFVAGDAITLVTNTGLPSVSYTATGAGTGTLSVQLGFSAPTLTLIGDYTGATFNVARATAVDNYTITVSGPTVSTDPLFDKAYYLAQNPDVAASGADPYTQYVTVGWQQGRNPSALFNTAYYLNQNPDVKAAGVNPLTHFETFGWKEGRDPSITFSDSRYLAANPDVKAAGVDPLVQYVQYGMTEGRAIYAATPHATGPVDPLVDAAYVYAHNPTIAAAGLDASAWYNTIGWQQGANPNAYFDTSYYLTQNTDVRAAGIDPLTHFETFGWKEGRQPSLVFDDAKYLGAYPDVAAAGVDPLVHYLSFGQSESRMTFLTGGAAPADPLVNATYYDRQLGATIIPAGTPGAQQAAYAYDHGGWQAGLNPDAFFDTNYYLSHNPDVAAAHINPLAHYEASGWKEGRDPSAAFSTNKYLAAYGDVRAAGVDPLLHYVVNGQAEGRTAFSV